MHRPQPGHCITVSTAGEPFNAFVPAPLPPDPPLVWSAALRRKFDAALVALGRLDSMLRANHLQLRGEMVEEGYITENQIESDSKRLQDPHFAMPCALMWSATGRQPGESGGP